MRIHPRTDLKHHFKEALAYSICQWLEMAEKRQIRRVRMWESVADQDTEEKRSLKNECH